MKFTVNRLLDKLYTKYTRQQIQSNSELVILENRLKGYKELLGGKQVITLTGLTKRLVKAHMGEISGGVSDVDVVQAGDPE